MTRKAVAIRRLRHLRRHTPMAQCGAIVVSAHDALRSAARAQASPLVQPGSEVRHRPQPSAHVARRGIVIQGLQDTATHEKARDAPRP